MKSGIKILITIIVLSPIAAFLVLGMFIYGLLPYPPPTIEKVYASPKGEKISLKGFKQQGWGNDGFLWRGQYWSDSESQPQKISGWIEYSESFIPQVYFVENFIVLIEDRQNFQVKTIDDNWQNYSLSHQDIYYISSIDSQIQSIRQKVTEPNTPLHFTYHHIKEFIPQTQELIIQFGRGSTESNILATMSLFISADGKVTLNNTSLAQDSTHPSFQKKFDWVTPE